MMDAQERGKVVAAEFFEDPSSEADLAQMVENHTLFAEQAARVKALEEAATICDEQAHDNSLGGEIYVLNQAAQAVRALKDKP